MYTQTPVNHESSSATHPLARGVRDLACDVISLAELQGQLLITDLREGRPQLARSAMLLMIAPLFGLAGVMLLLLGLSGIVAQWWECDLATAQLAVATVVLAVTILLTWYGWHYLTTAAGVLERSRSELSQNIAWIKAVLQTSPASLHRRSMPPR